MSLHISDDLDLPLEAVRWTFADLAIKGAGKTHNACVIAEEIMKNHVPIVAIDPIGIWWGLRVGVDGHEGLPVVVFGGEHQNIPIPTKDDKKTHYPQVDEEILKKVVSAILETGISAIIDTSEFSKTMQRRTASIIISELYRLNKHYGDRHIFLEEADTLAPQRLSGELYATFGAVDDLVRRGGNFNLGCTLITQRSAVLNKDVLTQCNCLMVLRILAKLDKDAVKEWVKEASGKDVNSLNEWYDTLKTLQNGEAWLWHPESDLFKRVMFRKRETLHATREYFRKQTTAIAVRNMNVDVFVEKYKDAFQKSAKTIDTPSLPPESSSKFTELTAKYDTLRADYDKIAASLKAMTEMANQDAKKIRELLVEIVEKNKKLEAYNKLGEALKELISPLAQVVAGTSQTQTGDIEHGPTIGEIRQVDPLKKTFKTDTHDGRIMYVLVHDLKKPSSEVMIAEQMAEYAWPNSHDVLKNPLTALVRDNWLKADDSTRPRLYIPPSKVKFDTDDKPEKK